jgi:UDP-glucose 4-epimerase
LNIHFPGVTYHFPKSQDEPSNHKKVSSKNARELYGWQPQHTLIDDIPLLIDAGKETTRARQSFAAKIGTLAAGLRPFLVWVEVLLGAFLMHMLTVWTSTIIEFKVIDYRLLFVVLIGSIHGLLFGIIAAILAAASAVIAWDNIGLDFALLIYNVENWIPFAVYFLAGAVTGYVHDKHENDLQFEKHQTELIHEKYSFLYELYNQISSIKNRLREQLVGYRDSFGRFFRIANELNELDEDNIFYKALEILEDLMKNDQIAIYSIESTGHFGRLQVSSKSITRDIPKSMRLDDYAGALPLLKSGEVFQNKDLVANYPAYIAPIMNANELIGLVIIWEASFEQFNMYYYNLFKVITGLIQSSLVRAATFENARYEQLFLPGTRIMRPDAFKQTFTIRNKMRRNKVSEFQILRIPRGENSWPEVFEMLSGSIRSEDVVGILDEDADTCYIILSNAGIENIGMIQERMKSNGISSEYVPELELD